MSPSQNTALESGPNPRWTIRSVLIRIPVLLLVFWSSGIVLGLATGWHDVISNGYLTRGYHANLIKTFESHIRWHALVMIFTGVIGSLFILSRNHMERVLRSRDIQAGSNPFLAYGGIVSFGFLALVIQFVVLNDTYYLSTWAVIIVTAAAVILSLLRNRINATKRAVADAGIFILLLSVVAVIFILDNPRLLSLFLLYRNVPAFVGVIACSGLLLLSLRIFRPPSGLRNRPAGTTALRGILIGLLFLIALIHPVLGYVSHRGMFQRYKAENPVNIILIGIDTLCWDHTFIQGITPAGRTTTPNMNTLANQSIVFENAISQAPWTMPAFASILTGKYPRNHGAISLKGRLSNRETTLAEILRECGYWTGGVVSHMFVDDLRGFSQGFDAFDESNKKSGILGITSHKLTSRIIEFLRGRPDDRPFFIFAHYFDPHYEFRNHRGFDFADDYTGWLSPRLLNIANLRSMRHTLKPGDIEHIKSVYDEEIAFCDREIGRLFDFLRQNNLYENTIIILVSDHGEEFMERGWIGHTITLFEELIHVPLIIYLPGADPATRRVSSVVETRAIFTTILDYLAIRPNPSPRGTSLLKTPSNSPRDSLQFAFSEVWLPRAPAASGKRVVLSSIRTNDHKLIMDHQKKQTHFYSLKKDPLERNNLIHDDHDADMYEILRAVLMSILERMPGSTALFPDAEVDPDLIRKLKSIGYL